MKRLIVILFMVSLLKAQNFGDVILEDTFGLYTPGSGNGVAWDDHDNTVIIAGYKRAHGSAVKKGWLIKYDPLSDDTIWSRFYGNYKYDFFNDVAYDPSGYYVAVGASATSSSVDFWILKLTTDGNVEWQGIYGNPSLYDEAKAVTLDSAGDYVVVGYERDSDGVDKAAILKIDANTNDTVWTRVYNTPDTSRLYDVFIDPNGYYVGVGEIYEAGYGWKMALWVIAPNNGDIVGGDEYGTSGSNHRGRCGLMSSDNNFIIAGYTDVNGDKDYEILKIKYSDFSVIWDSTYAISGDQEAWEITRINEDVYVGGYSSEKGNKDGFMMVIDDGFGRVVDMDLNGLSDVDDWEKSVVVYQDTILSVGGSENEHLLTHIRHSQNIRDSHLKDLSLRIGYEDRAYAIAIDSSGNYIIVGNTHSPDDADHWQILAVKYDPVQDRVLWWKVYSQRWGDSKANKVIVDRDGYYAIAGYTVNSSGNKDVWVLKLNPNTGDTVWTGVFGGDSDEVAMDIIEDLNGDYAVAGYTTSYGAGREDGWLLVLNASTGDTLYTKTYGGSEYDVFNAIAEDNGYYILAGVSSELHGWGDDWILKVDAQNGDTVWQRYYGDQEGQIAYDVIVDRDGNYVVGGKTYTNSTQDDVWVLKIESDSGDTIWTKSYGGSDSERGFSIREDKEGFYVIAGFTRSYGAGSSDYWALKLDPENGATLGQKTFGGTGDDMAECVSVDDSNHYVITGFSNSTTTGGYDFYTVKIYQGDNLPPVFDSITQLPNDTTLPFGPYQVDVKITDNLSGVDRGRLYWKSSEDADFSYSSLTYNTNNWWGASISEINITGDSALVYYYVDAYDSAGNYGVSDTLSFWVIKPDTEPPLIDSLTQVDKDTTIPHGPYEVRVKAWDEYRGVNNVRLYWKDEASSTFTESFMDSLGGDWWVDSIPEQVLNNDSTVIYYYVIAEDNAGNTSYSDTISFRVIDPDTTVPQIDSLTQLEKDTTIPHGPYEVMVKAWDNYKGMGNVEFYWKSAGDTVFTESFMDSLGGDWWIDSIPEQVLNNDSTVIYYYVIAEDNAGNTTYSDTLSFWVIDPDTTIPLVDNLTQLEKDTTIPHGPYEIKVEGYDNYKGLNSVKLYWRRNTDTVFNESSMIDYDSTHYWVDSIPEQVLNNDSVEIYYYVMAEDVGGNRAYTDTLSFWVIDPDTTVPQIDSLTQLENDTTIPHGPYEVKIKAWDDYKGMGNMKFYCKSAEDTVFTESFMDSLGGNWWVDTIPEEVLNNDSTEIYYYVIAEDNAGNTSYSDTLSFWVIDPDTTVPEIDSLTQIEKDTTIPHGPYEVKVKAWDDYKGISNVKFYWKNDASGTFTESFMDSLGGNWWVDSIPEQVLNNDSTIIYYYVVAEDIGGNITCSDTLSFWVIDPDTLPPEIDSLTKVLSDTTLPFGPYEVKVKSWDEYGSIQDVKFYWKNDTMSDFTVGNMAYLGGDWWVDSIPQQEFAADSMSILYYVVSEDSAGNSTITDTMSFWMVKPDTEPPLIDSLTQVDKDTTIPHGPYEIRVKAWDEYRGVSNVRLYWKDDTSSTFTESFMDSLGGDWWIDSIPEQILNNDSTVIYYYVIAEDNAGNTSYSDTISFWVVDPDTTVPQIDSVTQLERDNNPPYGPYDVWSKVKDEYRGLADVELYWKKESQPAFIQVSMSGTSDDWWYGSIPEQTLDTDSIRIVYYVKATDLGGNTSYSDTLSFYIVKPDTMAPQIDSLTQVDNDSTAPYGPYEVRVKVTDLYKKAGSLFGKGVLKDIKDKETSQVKLYWKLETEAVFNENSMAYLGNNWWIDSIPEESFSTDSVRVLYYVSAMDDAGNTSYSDTLSFWLIKLDTVKPVIDTVTQIERDSVPPYGPYEVWVNATDNKGVKYTRLYWKRASQPAFVQIDMNHAAGNWWVDSIPEQTLNQDSVLILYYAEAVDSSGNTCISDTLGFWIVSPDTMPPVIDSLAQIENDTMPPYGPYEVRVKVTDSRKGQVVFGIYKNNKHIALLNGKDAFLDKSAGKGVGSVKLYWKNDQDAVFHESDMSLQSGDWWIDTIPQQSPATHTMGVIYYVKATDEAGNTAYSDTLSFVIVTPDTTPPVIDSLTQLENDTTFPHGPYNIDVKVMDDYRGVSGVTLYWRTSLMSDFSHDAMVNISGNWWHDTIPQIDFTSVDSVEIFYFVTAADSSSNMSVSDTLSFWVINPDTTPPEIDSLTQIENDSTSPYGPYEVWVKVVDGYTGVDSVKLLYKKQSQPAFVESNMSYVAQNWWVDTIPEQSLQAEDSVIVMLYYIYAIDNAGNEVVSDTLSFELINPEYLIEEGKSITQFGVKIPSVCRNRLSFVFMAPSSDIYSVKVYSVNGRLLFNDRGKIKRGLTLMNLPLHKGGLYFVRIKFHGKTYYGKVLLVK